MLQVLLLTYRESGYPQLPMLREVSRANCICTLLTYNKYILFIIFGTCIVHV